MGSMCGITKNKQKSNTNTNNLFNNPLIILKAKGKNTRELENMKKAFNATRNLEKEIKEQKLKLKSSKMINLNNKPQEDNLLLKENKESNDLYSKLIRANTKHFNNNIEKLSPVANKEGVGKNAFGEEVNNDEVNMRFGNFNKYIFSSKENKKITDTDLNSKVKEEIKANNNSDKELNKSSDDSSNSLQQEGYFHKYYKEDSNGNIIRKESIDLDNISDKESNEKIQSKKTNESPLKKTITNNKNKNKDNLSELHELKSPLVLQTDRIKNEVFNLKKQKDFIREKKIRKRIKDTNKKYHTIEENNKDVLYEVNQNDNASKTSNDSKEPKTTRNRKVVFDKKVNLNPKLNYLKQFQNNEIDKKVVINGNNQETKFNSGNIKLPTTDNKYKKTSSLNKNYTYSNILKSKENGFEPDYCITKHPDFNDKACKENTTMNYKDIVINFSVKLGEYLTNIYIEKNTIINFYVEGDYNIGNRFSNISCIGAKDISEFYEKQNLKKNAFVIKERTRASKSSLIERMPKLNYGCLLGRIGSENTYFPISNFHHYVSKEEGPLLLSINFFNKDFKFDDTICFGDEDLVLSGRFKVTIIGGIEMSLKQVFSKTGLVIKSNFNEENLLMKNYINEMKSKQVVNERYLNTLDYYREFEEEYNKATMKTVTIPTNRNELNEPKIDYSYTSYIKNLFLMIQRVRVESQIFANKFAKVLSNNFFDESINRIYYHLIKVDSDIKKIDKFKFVDLSGLDENDYYEDGKIIENKFELKSEYCDNEFNENSNKSLMNIVEISEKHSISKSNNHHHRNDDIQLKNKLTLEQELVVLIQKKRVLKKKILENSTALKHCLKEIEDYEKVKMEKSNIEDSSNNDLSYINEDIAILKEAQKDFRIEYNRNKKKIKEYHDLLNSKNNKQVIKNSDKAIKVTNIKIPTLDIRTMTNSKGTLNTNDRSKNNNNIVYSIHDDENKSDILNETSSLSNSSISLSSLQEKISVLKNNRSPNKMNINSLINNNESGMMNNKINSSILNKNNQDIIDIDNVKSNKPCLSDSYANDDNSFKSDNSDINSDNYNSYVGNKNIINNYIDSFDDLNKDNIKHLNLKFPNNVGASIESLDDDLPEINYYKKKNYIQYVLPYFSDIYCTVIQLLINDFITEVDEFATILNPEFIKIGIKVIKEKLNEKYMSTQENQEIEKLENFNRETQILKLKTNKTANSNIDNSNSSLNKTKTFTENLENLKKKEYDEAMKNIKITREITKVLVRFYCE